MSTTAPTSASTATDTFGGVSASASSNSAGSLGESDFLELMMDQLKNQDPLNPADPTQYMSELASFSSLEQQMQISESSTESAADESANAALNLVGKSVSYTDSSGATATGTVSSVDFTSSGPTLTIGSTSGISLSSITSATASS